MVVENDTKRPAAPTAGIADSAATGTAAATMTTPVVPVAAPATAPIAANATAAAAAAPATDPIAATAPAAAAAAAPAAAAATTTTTPVVSAAAPATGSIAATAPATAPATAAAAAPAAAPIAAAAPAATPIAAAAPAAAASTAAATTTTPVVPVAVPAIAPIAATAPAAAPAAPAAAATTTTPVVPAAAPAAAAMTTTTPVVPAAATTTPVVPAAAPAAAPIAAAAPAAASIAATAPAAAAAPAATTTTPVVPAAAPAAAPITTAAAAALAASVAAAATAPATSHTPASAAFAVALANHKRMLADKFRCYHEPPISRFFAFRGSSSLKSPAIFTSWDDCCVYVRSKDRGNANFQEFDNIISAIEYLFPPSPSYPPVGPTAGGTVAALYPTPIPPALVAAYPTQVAPSIVAAAAAALQNSITPPVATGAAAAPIGVEAEVAAFQQSLGRKRARVEVDHSALSKLAEVQRSQKRQRLQELLSSMHVPEYYRERVAMYKEYQEEFKKNDIDESLFNTRELQTKYNGLAVWVKREQKRLQMHIENPSESSSTMENDAKIKILKELGITHDFTDAVGGSKKGSRRGGKRLRNWDANFENYLKFLKMNETAEVKVRLRDYKHELEAWVYHQRKVLAKRIEDPNSVYLDEERVQRLKDAGVTPLFRKKDRPSTPRVTYKPPSNDYEALVQRKLKEIVKNPTLVLTGFTDENDKAQQSEENPDDAKRQSTVGGSSEVGEDNSSQNPATDDTTETAATNATSKVQKRERRWEENFALLKEYKQVFGTCDVMPGSTTTGKFRGLYKFVCTERDRVMRVKNRQRAEEGLKRLDQLRQQKKQQGEQQGGGERLPAAEGTTSEQDQDEAGAKPNTVVAASGTEIDGQTSTQDETDKDEGNKADQDIPTEAPAGGKEKETEEEKESQGESKQHGDTNITDDKENDSNKDDKNEDKNNATSPDDTAKAGPDKDDQIVPQRSNGWQQDRDEDLVRRLMEIGFVETPGTEYNDAIQRIFGKQNIWSAKRIATWEVNYDLLKQFKEKTGSVHMKCTDEGFNVKLHRWASFQARHIKFFDSGEHEKCILDSTRVQRLKDLGVHEVGYTLKKPPTKTPARKRPWDEMLEELRAYKEEHGHCNVPQKPRSVLRTWVVIQREDYKKLKEGSATELTPEKLSKLSSLGFIFETPTRKKFDHRLAEWVAYRSEHGKTPSQESGTLGKWIAKMRRKYRYKKAGRKTDITQEQIDKLDKLNFPWDSGVKRPENVAPPKSWDERFQELLQFREEHGHVNVPQLYPILGPWVHRQRKDYSLMKRGKPNRMKPEHLERLQAIDFVFITRKSPLEPPRPGQPKRPSRAKKNTVSNNNNNGNDNNTATTRARTMVTTGTSLDPTSRAVNTAAAARLPTRAASNNAKAKRGGGGGTKKSTSSPTTATRGRGISQRQQQRVTKNVENSDDDDDDDDDDRSSVGSSSSDDEASIGSDNEQGDDDDDDDERMATIIEEVAGVGHGGYTHQQHQAPATDHIDLYHHHHPTEVIPAGTAAAAAAAAAASMRGVGNPLVNTTTAAAPGMALHYQHQHHHQQQHHQQQQQQPQHQFPWDRYKI